MERKKYIGLVLALFTSVLVSCQKNTADYGYLRIDQHSYMFKSDGSDTCRIGVESNVSWSLDGVPEWVELIEKGDDYVLLKASDNETKSVRVADVVFVSEAESPVLSLSQSIGGFNGRFYDLTDLAAPAMSRNGMYIAGMRGRLDDNGRGVFTPVVLNTHTGKVIEMEPTYDFNGMKYINNEGNVIVMSNSYSGRTEMFIDGEMVEVRLPEGYHNHRIYSASEDNTIWAGYCQSISTQRYHPVRWTNGEPEIMDMPSSNLWGQDVSHNGTMIRGCSSDGSIMYGSEWDSMGLVCWENGKMNFIGGDPAYNILGYDNPDNPSALTSYTGIVADASTVRMSPNGRYVSATYVSWDESYTGYMVTLIDLETGNVEIKESLEDSGGATVDNNGNFFGGVPRKSPMLGYKMSFGEEPVPMTEWFQSEYGLSFVDGYMVQTISEDGKTILGARAQMTVYGVKYAFWCVATDVFKE